ncbi:MAG: hypothetical protein ABWZ57_12440 [Mesorhizobium sp.]
MTDEQLCAELNISLMKFGAALGLNSPNTSMTSDETARERVIAPLVVAYVYCRHE